MLMRCEKWGVDKVNWLKKLFSVNLPILKTKTETMQTNTPLIANIFLEQAEDARIHPQFIFFGYLAQAKKKSEPFFFISKKLLFRW